MITPSTINPPKKTTQKPLIKPPTNPLLSLLFIFRSLPYRREQNHAGYIIVGAVPPCPPFHIASNKALSSLQQDGWQPFRFFIPRVNLEPPDSKAVTPSNGSAPSSPYTMAPPTISPSNSISAMVISMSTGFPSFQSALPTEVRRDSGQSRNCCNHIVVLIRSPNRN